MAAAGISPCIFLDEQFNAADVAKSIISKWTGNFGPNLILSLISDPISPNISQESHKFLIAGFSQLFRSTSTWVITADDGFLSTAADEALKLIREDQGYMERHQDYLDDHGRARWRPETNSLIFCVTSKARAERSSFLASNFIIFEREDVPPEEVEAARAGLVRHLSLTPFVTKVMREISMSEAKSHGVERAHSTAIKKTDARSPFLTIFGGRSINSLKALARDVNCGIPTVLLEDSTRLCEMLAESLRKYYNCKLDHHMFSENILLLLPSILNDPDSILTVQKVDEAVSATIRILRFCVQRRKRMISSTRLSESMENETPLSTTLLRALLHHGSVAWKEARLFPLFVHLNHPVLAKQVSLPDSFFTSERSLRYFLEALRYREREDMVPFFLGSDFQIGYFLTPELYWELFTTIENQSFFESVVLGRLLGYSVYPTNRDVFLSLRLPKLLETLTNIPGLFREDILRRPGSEASNSLVNRSFDLMAYWAILMNRGTLAKQFVVYSAEPLPLSLILSKMCASLADETKDRHLHEETMRRLSEDFATMANDILDASYATSPHRSYDVLCRSFPQFGGLTATQIALISGNKAFIAHRCCQMWVSHRMFGPLQMTKLHCGFSIPTWAKVLLCATFVFPMKFWLRMTLTADPSRDHGTSAAKASYFVAMHSRKDGSKKVKEVKDEMEMKRLLQQKEDARDSEVEAAESSDGRRDEIQKIFDISPIQRALSIEPMEPLCRIAPLFYQTPVTKYWLSLVFKLIHLVLFGYSLSLPGCGSIVWDAIVWIWAAASWLESLFILVEKKRMKFTADYLQWETLDLIATACFLILSAFLKLATAHFYIGYLPIGAFTGRCAMSLFFLYLCYATLFIYIPMSETLGPLLVRIKLMIMRDLINFLTLTFIIILASGIVVHTIVFPDFPDGTRLWHQALHWAGFSLFTTDLSYLKETASCRASWYTIVNASGYSGLEQQCQRTSGYADPQCPKQSTAAYFAVIQYFVILKLICWPLLFALFGKTAKEVDDEADFIWKHQLYCLVSDFSLRPPVPAPFTILYLPIKLSFTLVSRIRCCCRDKPVPPKDFMDGDEVSFGRIIKHRPRDPHYHSYWRALAQQQWTQHKGKYSVDFLESDTEQVPSMDFMLHSSTKKISMAKPYGVKQVPRLKIPESFVDFSILLPEYSPVVYSKEIDQFVVKLRVITDSAEEWSVPMIDWSERSSFFEEGFEVGPGNYPINPDGRQGISGRGDLPRFGPNLLCLFAIRDSIGQKFMVLPKDLLQPSGPGLPKAFITDAALISDEERIHQLLRESLHLPEGKIIAVKDLKLKFKKKPKTPLDTDNAWIETAVFTAEASSAEGTDKISWKDRTSIRHLNDMDFLIISDLS